MENQTTIRLQKLFESDNGVELLWISNLLRKTPVQEIVGFFEKHVGPVECFTEHYNANGGYSCKAGIYFRQPRNARKALFYDGTMLGGRRMNLKLFVNQERIYKDQIVIPGQVSSENLSHVPLINYIFQDFHNDGDLLQSSSGEQTWSQKTVTPLKSLEVAQDFIPQYYESPQSDSVYVLVSNLQYSVSGKQIFDLFEHLVGPVQSVGVYLDDKGFLIGKAKIIFHRPDDARKAAVLSDKKLNLNGRKMILQLFVNGKPMCANCYFLAALG